MKKDGEKVMREHFLRANLAASASDDLQTQVGCLILTKDGTAIEGANTLPKGCNVFPETRRKRPEKYKWIEHAERNAIFTAAKSGIILEGATMVLPWFPCVECTRAVIQSGIIKLCCYRPDYSNITWGSDFRIAICMFEESGVEVEFFTEFH